MMNGETLTNKVNRVTNKHQTTQESEAVHKLLSLPSVCRFSVIPGDILCSIMASISAGLSLAGHHISVNLFRKAGESCQHINDKLQALRHAYYQ